MYPSDTMIEFVGLEEEMAMGDYGEPLTDTETQCSEPTENLFEGINNLILSLLARHPSGLDLAMLQSLTYMVGQLQCRIFSPLKPYQL